MTTDDMHQVTFIWPRTDAGSVILTGTFDNWSKSIRLTKSPKGFTGSIKIPWNETIAYKYIVDGNWSLDDSKPKRVERGGYVNNVYVAPSKPPTYQETMVPVKAPSGTLVVNGTVNGIHIGEATTKIPVELHQSKINGHPEMSKPPQDAPSVQGTDKEGDLSIEEDPKSIPVDRHPVDCDGGVDKEERISQAKEDEKPLAPETVGSAPRTGLTSPNAEQEVSQAEPSNGSITSAMPEERKRSTIMAFVPVNFPPETPPVDGSLHHGSNGVSGEETSTHKPLGLVSKTPQSPTTTSEIVAGPAEQSTTKQTADEAPVQSESATTEAGPLQGTVEESSASIPPTAVDPEEKADIPIVRPATAPAPTAQLPETMATEASPPDAAELVVESSVPTPAKEAEAPAGTMKIPEPVAVAVAPTEPKSTGKSPSAPTSPTKSKFPRFSRDSSASEPSQNGHIRKRKSTFLEKIKHIFSHDKEKGRGKGKKL